LTFEWQETEFKMSGRALVWRCGLLRRITGDENTPLLLSGGERSGTILAAQLSLRGRPDLYCSPATSEQLRTVRAMAGAFQLTVSISEPRRDETAADAAIRLARLEGHRRLLAGRSGIPDKDNGQTPPNALDDEPDTRIISEIASPFETYEWVGNPVETFPEFWCMDWGKE
jgi:hypothetical protein